MEHKGIFLGSQIVEQKQPNPSGQKLGKVALRPGTAGEKSNPVSGKYDFMFVCVFWALNGWPRVGTCKEVLIIYGVLSSMLRKNPE